MDRRDSGGLAVVLSPSALFDLMDLAGVPAEEAVATILDTAAVLTSYVRTVAP